MGAIKTEIPCELCGFGIVVGFVFPIGKDRYICEACRDNIIFSERIWVNCRSNENDNKNQQVMGLESHE